MSFKITKDLYVDNAMRRELSGTFGKIVKGRNVLREVRRSAQIYAIGDVTVSTLLELGYSPKIAIFDYRTERSDVDFPVIRANYKKPVRVKNKRGSLSIKLWRAVEKAVKAKGAVGIRVDGEEDLASLACIHFAKNGQVVMYGIRDRGMTIIRVNTSIKKYVEDVLSKMSKI